MKNKITGNTLIDLGYTPAAWFKTALLYLNTLNRVTPEDIRYYCDPLAKSLEVEIIEPLSVPADCDVYLHADPKNADEVRNKELVKETMWEVLKTPYSVYGAIMPDACPAGPVGTIPVGGLAVMENVIVPGMHSADICCSVYASNLGPNVDEKELMDIAFKVTQFGPGRRKEHGGWENLAYDDGFLYQMIVQNYFTKDFLGKAAAQMGTQGDGNHFLFIGRSQATNDVYIVTHHGSRGFGASVFKKGMFEAEKLRRKCSPNTHRQNAWLPYSDEIGQEYWRALEAVRAWTFRNHMHIHQRIANKMGLPILDHFWNEHNFVFKSENFDKAPLFYHAKGVTPVGKSIQAGSPGDPRRLIPLSMSQPILVVTQGNYRDDTSFAPHGAGRNFGRTEFLKRGNTPEKLAKEIEGLDVRFYSGIPDASEYPSAYKPAASVISQIELYGLAKIVDQIIPYGSIMAGNAQLAK